MKILVDLDLCEANGVCESHCPQVFHVTDEDELEVAQEAIDHSLLESLQMAINRCPRQALTLVDPAEEPRG